MKKIKICGLSQAADIAVINTVKPDYCGFIINYPKSRRNISPEAIQSFRAKLNPAITTVGVFVDQPVELVAKLLNKSIVSIAQLHGHEDNCYIAALRQLTASPIWKALQITCQEEATQALKSMADFVLLDAGQGCGKAFDWSILAGFSRPFGLAGGLNIENLHEALQTEASLLDVSSGVETGGVKDPDKIKNFVKTARGLRSLIQGDLPYA